MKRAGIALVLASIALLTLGAMLRPPELVVRDDAAWDDIGDLQAELRDHTEQMHRARLVLGIGLIVGLAGVAFLATDHHDRRARQPDGRALLPPPAAPPPPGGHTAVTPMAMPGPGAPVTMFDDVAPRAHPLLDPTVEYLDGGLGRADGELLQVGHCRECGAPNVVLRNPETRIRHLACSTPACTGRDVLRRANGRPS